MHQWSVVQVRPGLELKFAAELEDAAYCPPETKRWTARGKPYSREQAVLTGYVFTKKNPIDAVDWHTVADINGFNRFLPGAPVTDEELDRLRQLLAEEQPTKQTRRYNQGDMLKVISGVYLGWSLICQEHRGEKIFATTPLHLGQSILCIPSACCILDDATQVAAQSSDVTVHQRRTRRQRRRFARKKNIA